MSRHWPLLPAPLPDGDVEQGCQRSQGLGAESCHGSQAYTSLVTVLAHATSLQGRHGSTRECSCTVGQVGSSSGAGFRHANVARHGRHSL
jgi:hypothetical protein